MQYVLSCSPQENHRRCAFEVEVSRSEHLTQTSFHRSAQPIWRQKYPQRECTLLGIIVLLSGCTSPAGPSAQQPNLGLHESPSAVKTAALDIGHVTPGTAYRLLRMEADLIYSCSGADGEAWYLQHAAPLDTLVSNAKASIAR